MDDCDTASDYQSLLNAESDLDYWDYGEHLLPGWIQTGNVHGKKFGCWARQLYDGTTMSITLGDDSKRYWLRIGSCYYGNHKSPEVAAQKSEEILEEIATGCVECGEPINAGRRKAIPGVQTCIECAILQERRR